MLKAVLLPGFSADCLLPQWPTTSGFPPNLNGLAVLDCLPSFKKLVHAALFMVLF